VGLLQMNAHTSFLDVNRTPFTAFSKTFTALLRDHFFFLWGSFEFV